MKFVRLFIILSFCFVLAGTAIALDAAFEEDFNYTPTEEVGFAFYKLGNIRPRFDSWIKQKEKYAELKPRLQYRFLKQEKRRLQFGYYNFSPKKNVITFETQVVIQSMDKSELKRTNERYLMAYFKGDKEMFHFPFLVGEDWVAIVPENMESSIKIDMSKKRYNELRKFLFSSNTQHLNGVLDVVVLPTHVDTRSPFMIEGVDMWLMSARLISLVVWDRKKTTVLWEYTAEGYIPETQRSLMNLYEEERASEK